MTNLRSFNSNVGNVRGITEGQKKYLKSLVSQLETEYKEEYDRLTMAEASALLTSLQNEVNMLINTGKEVKSTGNITGDITDRQKETIISLSAERGLDAPKNLDNMSRSQASETITKLIAYNRRHNLTVLSAKQIELVKNMVMSKQFVVDDIIGIQPNWRRVVENLKKMVKLSSDTEVERNRIAKFNELYDSLANDFVNKSDDEIRSLGIENEVNKLIDNHRNDYYDWVDTRATQFQIDKIIELSKQINNVSSWSYVEDTLSDEIDSLNSYTDNSYNTGYQLNIEQLRFYSKEQASALIQQLSKEIRNLGDFSKFQIEEEIDDSKSRATDLEDNIMNVVHGLYANVGMKFEEGETDDEEALKEALELNIIFNGLEETKELMEENNIDPAWLMGIVTPDIPAEIAEKVDLVF